MTKVVRVQRKAHARLRHHLTLDVLNRLTFPSLDPDPEEAADIWWSLRDELRRLAGHQYDPARNSPLWFFWPDIPPGLRVDVGMEDPFAVLSPDEMAEQDARREEQLAGRRSWLARHPEMMEEARE